MGRHLRHPRLRPPRHRLCRRLLFNEVQGHDRRLQGHLQRIHQSGRRPADHHALVRDAPVHELREEMGSQARGRGGQDRRRPRQPVVDLLLGLHRGVPRGGRVRDLPGGRVDDDIVDRDPARGDRGGADRPRCRVRPVLHRTADQGHCVVLRAVVLAAVLHRGGADVACDGEGEEKRGGGVERALFAFMFGSVSRGERREGTGKTRR